MSIEVLVLSLATSSDLRLEINHAAYQVRQLQGMQHIEFVNRSSVIVKNSLAGTTTTPGRMNGSLGSHCTASRELPAPTV